HVPSAGGAGGADREPRLPPPRRPGDDHAVLPGAPPSDRGGSGLGAGRGDAVSRPVPPLRTYSHLEGQRRIPSEYEIVTTNLLYYPARGFEVEVPVRAWYDRHQRGGGLACSDWERFRDP